MRWPWSKAHSADDSTPSDPGGRRPTSGQTAVPRSADSSRTPSIRSAAAAEPGPDKDGRPVWLLDVDGVLNANRPGWGGRPAEGYAHAGDGQFWIRWSPELVRRIIAVHRTGAVEVRWATTWVPWIGAIEELLGLPTWPVAWEGPHEGVDTPAIPTPLRKVQTALYVVERERRPLIWTDDDAIPTHGSAHDRITSAGVPCLLVRPSSRAGLQPSDLDAVEEFLRENGPERTQAEFR